MAIERAAFAAGCFWSKEFKFSKLKGVISTQVGYMGGTTHENISYEKVSSGKTGHAETVEVSYDNKKISYEQLLDEFWKMHDPTTKDRQGSDIGSQYRSIIFYYNSKQKDTAEKSKQERQKILGDKKIVTEIIPASIFHKAEEYHQKYLEKQGKNSCQI